MTVKEETKTIVQQARELAGGPPLILDKSKLTDDGKRRFDNVIAAESSERSNCKSLVVTFFAMMLFILFHS